MRYTFFLLALRVAVAHSQSYSWSTGAASCPSACGTPATAIYRLVACQHILKDQVSFVDDSFCSSTPKPSMAVDCPATPDCGNQARYQWEVSGDCPTTCGFSARAIERSVQCLSFLNDDPKGKLCSDSFCEPATKPSESISCPATTPCACSWLEVPVQCPTSCGTPATTLDKTVFCRGVMDGVTIAVADSHCPAPKPPTSVACPPAPPCDAKATDTKPPEVAASSSSSSASTSESCSWLVGDFFACVDPCGGDNGVPELRINRTVRCSCDGTKESEVCSSPKPLNSILCPLCHQGDMRLGLLPGVFNKKEEDAVINVCAKALYEMASATQSLFSVELTITSEGTCFMVNPNFLASTNQASNSDPSRHVRRAISELTEAAATKTTQTAQTSEGLRFSFAGVSSMLASVLVGSSDAAAVTTAVLRRLFCFFAGTAGLALVHMWRKGRSKRCMEYDETSIIID